METDVAHLKVRELMEQPHAVYPPHATVAEVVADLRGLCAERLVVYAWIVERNRLIGVLTFRDLLFARPEQVVTELMLREPFAFKEEQALDEAWLEAAKRQLPIYPVCDARGVLVGLLPGPLLFARQRETLAGQAGRSVGVASSDRAGTAWTRRLRLRLPWLTISLLTVFLGAWVIGEGADSIRRYALLAVFLPVVAGQSLNIGTQALGICLRGLALGEQNPARLWAPVITEAWIGTAGGLLSGLASGAVMYIAARQSDPASALMLAWIVCVAMVLSCAAAGAFGAGLPLVLARRGADPASAAGILLGTVTDVISFALLLGLPALLSVHR